jgi:hypothetical protein
MRVYKVLHPTDPKRHQGVTLEDVYGVIKPKRRENMMPRSHPVGVTVPDTDELQADLCGPSFKYDSNTRLLLEKKEDMRKRGVPSPDIGDAITLTFAGPVNPPMPRARADQDCARRVDGELSMQNHPFLMYAAASSRGGGASRRLLLKLFQHFKSLVYRFPKVGNRSRTASQSARNDKFDSRFTVLSGDQSAGSQLNLDRARHCAEGRGDIKIDEGSGIGAMKWWERIGHGIGPSGVGKSRATL